MQRSLEQEVYLSLNLPCFPSVCGHRFNAKTLPKTNLTRAEEFVARIKDEKPEVIALQEIWDPAVADYLQIELRTIYPYQLRGIHGDIKCPPPRRVSGGLMFFSQQPILDVKTGKYNNLILGEETFGEKGFAAIKTLSKLRRNKFTTFINTHLQADGDFYLGFSIFWGGTTSFRRSQQMKIIHDATHNWAKQIPEDFEASHLHTVMMGDFNTRLDCRINGDEVNDLHWLGIEITNKQYQLRNTGQHELMSQYEPIQPENYVNLRLDQEEKKGGPFYSGTVKNDLIDLITLRKDGDKMGQLLTQIISFGDISDHLGIKGILDMSLPFKHRKGKYSYCQFIKLSGLNPSAGLWNKYKQNHTAIFQLKRVEEEKEKTILREFQSHQKKANI